jgi:hypothetical protein
LETGVEISMLNPLDQSIAPDQHEQPPSTSVGAALGWSVAALSVLGLGIGWFAGLSASPVVSTLLPLLFGLLGGTGGFYFQKLDLTSSKDVRSLRFLSIGLLVLGIMCVAGSFFGILLRTGRLFSSNSSETQGSISQITGSKNGDAFSASELLTLNVLARKLELLGVDPASRTSVIVATEEEMRRRPHITAIRPGDVITIAGTMSEIIGGLKARTSKAPPYQISNLVYQLSSYAPYFEATADQIKRGVGTDQSAWRTALTDIDVMISKFVSEIDSTQLNWLSGNRFDLNKLWDLRLGIKSAQARITNPTPESQNATQDLDKLVNVLVGSTKTSETSDYRPFFSLAEEKQNNPRTIESPFPFPR